MGSIVPTHLAMCIALCRYMCQPTTLMVAQCTLLVHKCTHVYVPTNLSCIVNNQRNKTLLIKSSSFGHQKRYYCEPLLHNLESMLKFFLPYISMIIIQMVNNFSNIYLMQSLYLLQRSGQIIERIIWIYFLERSKAKHSRLFCICI